MKMVRCWTLLAGGGIALLVGGLAPPATRAADREHPLGVFPYGIFAPTMADLWADLPRTEMHRMNKATSWGMLGPMEYGCNGPGCGGHGGGHGWGGYGGGGCGAPGNFGPWGCCGLTPLHWNAYAPSLFNKEPGPPNYQREISWYAQEKPGFLPVPGVDAPAMPPDIAHGNRPPAFHNAPGVPHHTPYAMPPMWSVRPAAATDPAAAPAYFGPYQQYRDPYAR